MRRRNGACNSGEDEKATKVKRLLDVTAEKQYISAKRRRNVLESLPIAVLGRVLSFLEGTEMGRLAVVCKKFKAFSEDEKNWEKLSKAKYSWIRPNKKQRDTWKTFYIDMVKSSSHDSGILVLGGGRTFVLNPSTETGILMDYTIEGEGIGVSLDEEEKLYMVGGWDPLSGVRQGVFCLHQLEPIVHEALPSLRVARCYAGFSCGDGLMICSGGAESPYSNDGEVFRSSEIFRRQTEEWTEGPHLNHRRSGLDIIFHGRSSTFCALGGYGGGDCFHDTFETLSSSGTRWHLDSRKMKSKRSGAGFVIGMHNEIYAVGGSVDGNIMLDEVERLDLREREWKASKKLHRKRGYLAATTSPQGCIYAIGGVADWNSGENGSIERFDPRMEKWEMLAIRLSPDRHSHSAVSLVRSEIERGVFTLPAISSMLETGNEPHLMLDLKNPDEN